MEARFNPLQIIFLAAVMYTTYLSPPHPNNMYVATQKGSFLKTVS